MMEWYQIISYLLTTELRLILGLYLVAKLMNFSLDKKALAFAVLGGVFVTAAYVTALPTTVIIAAEMVILAVITWYYLREQMQICLFLVFFYEIGVALWDFLISAWLGVLFQSTRFIETDAREHLISIWFVRLLMVIITALLLKRQTRRKKDNVFRPTSAIAVLGLLGVVSLSQQSVLSFNDDQLNVWIILSTLLMIAILFYRIKRQHEMELEIARLKQDQVEILERDYQALSKIYADNAKLYHDLHNHIEAIYQCLTQNDIQEALRYCEDLRTPVREISQTVWTGDKAIDYLISSKMALAEQEHIKTTVNIEYPHNTNIRSVDLTTILGNLLDNALEAVEIAPDNLRFLNLTVRRINAMLIIKVENGCSEIPVQEDGKWLTSKTDKAFHGWGLKSVQSAAERYDGTINTEYKDSVFKSVVTLSFQPIKTE